MREWFSSFSLRLAEAVGSSLTFLIAVGLVAAWLLVGSGFAYSERWMAVFSTAVSTITFLMVFLIQNAQNRNAKALHLKINELIRGLEGPRTELVNIEQRTDKEIRVLGEEFVQVAEEAGRQVAQVPDEAADRTSKAADKAKNSGSRRQGDPDTS